jgi:hypothetical protein
MNKRQSSSGRVLLYDIQNEFVTSKLYGSLNERQKIIQGWIRFYRLENRMYYINIIPNIKEEKEKW